jgi:hypothetical protein
MKFFHILLFGSLIRAEEEKVLALPSHPVVASLLKKLIKWILLIADKYSICIIVFYYWEYYLRLDHLLTKFHLNIREFNFKQNLFKDFGCLVSRFCLKFLGLYRFYRKKDWSQAPKGNPKFWILEEILVKKVNLL